MYVLLLLQILRLVSASNSINFLFLGDWGYAGTNQSLIASQMGDWAGQNKADFVISLGDNFYSKCY